ncbi:MAG: hypothetical protein ACE5KX_01485, partial [Acidimicrobiia bacterium]
CLAVDCVPYQQSIFGTPAFDGYVSGQRTFSRASAEVLIGFTGSEFFPGDLGEWTIAAGSLDFEEGPGWEITLQCRPILILWTRSASRDCTAGFTSELTISRVG